MPNLGLRNEQLRTLVQGQPNQALVDSLVVDNDNEPTALLKRLTEQFAERCKGHYRVVTFFERLYSPTLEVRSYMLALFRIKKGIHKLIPVYQRAPDGKLRKTGRLSLLVTEKSATSTNLVAVADKDNIPLNTDHSGLVKYKSRNQGDYTIARERIRILVDEAKLEVVKRFAEHSTSLHTRCWTNTNSVAQIYTFPGRRVQQHA